jgi:sodium transport system permease protein
VNGRNIGVIFRKELIDALRDKRTIIATIVVPVLIFPVITIGFGALAMTHVKKMQQEAEQKGSSVMLLGAEHAPRLAGALSNAPGVRLVAPAEDYVTRINEKQLRAAVEFPPGFEDSLGAGGTNAPEVKLLHYLGESRSQIAVAAVENALRQERDRIVEERLATRGLSRDVLQPFAYERRNVAEPKKVGGNILGGFIPYTIIFLCFVGAMNPAIDLTAGEKERGTIETILASPVSRTDLVAGKFLLVLLVSIVTAVVSLASFAATFALPLAAVKAMGRAGPNALPFEIGLGAVGSVLLLMLPLAIMFSAALLSLGLFARTNKEAQGYLGPLMMLVIMPAMAGLLPGFEVNAKLALVPILNVSLVAKDLLTGHYQWGLIALVFGSSCVYAALALTVAVWTFKRESVLFRT